MKRVEYFIYINDFLSYLCDVLILNKDKMRTTSIQVLLFLTLSLFSTISCKKDKAEDFKMESQGPIGEVMVVCNKEYFRKDLGKSIVSVLESPYSGLPTSEPSFDIDSLPSSLFGGYVTRHRNILQISVNPKAKNRLLKKDDFFAFNQHYILVEAQSESIATDIVKKNKRLILDYFEQNEIKHFAKYYNKSHSVTTDTIASLLGFTVSCPDFSVKRKTPDFMWISKETKRTSLAILMYSVPYTSQEQFSPDSLIKIKNQFMKKYVEGPEDGSYISVEKLVPISSKVEKIQGHYATILRGAWTLVGGIMGGPFVMDAILDEENQRIIILDSYIFAPEARFNRVNLLREAQGVFNTLKITAENKIND